MYEAARGLRNYLHFQNLDSQKVYELRKIIEVELAASVVGHLDEAAFRRLAENIDICACPRRAWRLSGNGVLPNWSFITFWRRAAQVRCCPSSANFLTICCATWSVSVNLRSTFNLERRQFAVSNCHYQRLLLEA